ncbi:DNA polymerase III subunit epsilon [Pseudomonas alcaligenes]|uniref:DNA polymerase III subunit epsilon n=1 Tax=Aquipseudomonas alcaligenes TaxID=43263 RepID=A0ABR7RXX1_AQUAC|nr:3'-5' exonuclease [Pseudomonas alcaligenes]MBC9248983.1 DNA polymerase III subunit epsilon [Pseudomonas alcaligenes]
MKLFTWLQRGAPPLNERQQQRCARLQAPAGLDERPLQQQRIVVLDLETSGLDLQRDQLLAIGAVVIEDGAIDFSQQYEATLCRAGHQASASTLIHGLAPSAIAAGSEPAEALLGFMEFLGDSPLLAFHAAFDQHMLARALKQSLGLRLRHPFLDVAELAPLLCAEAPPRCHDLDDWLQHFQLQVSNRHHASADALATAELALILLSRAKRQGLDGLAALQRAVQARRQRLQAPSL